MYQPPASLTPPKIQRIKQLGFLQGYQSTLDDDRKSADGLKTAANVVLEQNGTVRPRPSLVLYGSQPTGTVLGQVYPYVKLNGSTPENWEACVQNVGGTSQVYIRKDGGAWSACSGKTYDLAARCHLEQVNSKVLITNGVDYLSYLDVQAAAVVPFTALSTVTGVSAANGGSPDLTTSPSFSWRVRITATNGVGETAGSTAGTIQINTIRDEWGAGQYLTYTWNRVTNATRYNIYVGDEAGFEYYIDTVSDIGSGGTQSYKDNASIALNTNRLCPNGDSTAGMRATRATNVLGQVYLVGDTDNPYRLWFGGTGDSALDFSPFNGGGWVEIDKGGKYFPAVVKGFRTGKGDAAVTIFMKGTSGTGKLVHGIQASTTLGTTVIDYLSLQEDNGEDGPDGPDAVLYAEDSYWYLSRSGPKTTGTAANKQNILSTQNFATAIDGSYGVGYKQLNVKAMDYAVGEVFENKLYYSVPVGTSTNSQVWVCDLNRNGAWMLPWYISVDWIWKYDDNTGLTHLMVLSGNQTYELSRAQATQDNGVAFTTTVGSGLIKFSDDGMEWGSVIDVTFIVLQPQGTLNLSIIGLTEDGATSTVANESFTSSFTTAGWNEAGWNRYQYYWNAVVTIPTSFGQTRVAIAVEVDTELNWFRWELSSSAANVDYQLSEVVTRFVDIGVIEQ